MYIHSAVSYSTFISTLFASIAVGPQAARESSVNEGDNLVTSPIFESSRALKGACFISPYFQESPGKSTPLDSLFYSLERRFTVLICPIHYTSKPLRSVNLQTPTPCRAGLQVNIESEEWGAGSIRGCASPLM